MEESLVSSSINGIKCPNSTHGFCHKARRLTEEEIAKLEKDKSVVSEFKQKKLETEAQKNWDLFYKRNTINFFKDRHWTKREFDELTSTDSEKKKIILEVGCGVGNFIWPLLQEDDNLFFYACDFSKRAVQFVKDHKEYDPARCHAFHCDLTKDDLTWEIQADTVDVVSMIFVLSAIHPDKMAAALTNIYKVLRPGGCILFRDYGLYDYAMLRFAPGHKLSENFYVRQDGTRAYYFSLEVLVALICEAGFDMTASSCDYKQRETVNKKESLCVPRIFVQGKFVKPSHCSQEQYSCTSVTHCRQGQDLCKSMTHKQGDCNSDTGMTSPESIAVSLQKTVEPITCDRCDVSDKYDHDQTTDKRNICADTHSDITHSMDGLDIKSCYSELMNTTSESDDKPSDRAENKES